MDEIGEKDEKSEISGSDGNNDLKHSNLQARISRAKMRIIFFKVFDDKRRITINTQVMYIYI